VVDDRVVHHAYSTYARGVDALWGANRCVDRAPKRRNQHDPWWNRHDEYAT
jgi:predicted dithiol-disulfide oxidoreductase (DUF899 family)